MGRKRKHDKHLPRRMYKRGASFYFVHPSGEWEPLGRDYGEALQKWARLAGDSQTYRTLNAVFDRYDAEVIPTKALRTQQTNRAELAWLRKVFGEMPPDAVAETHIYKYLDDRKNPRTGKKSPIRASREIALLSHVYSKAIRWGAAKRNPCLRIEKHKSKPRERDVTAAEFWAVCRLAREKGLHGIRVAMHLARITGIREGNQVSATLDDFVEEGLFVQANKRGKPRIFRWTPGLRRIHRMALALKRRVDRNLVLNRSGKAYTEDGLRSTWHKLQAEAVARGLIEERYWVHDLRAMANAESKDGTKLLGHTNPNTTRKHYQRRPELVEPNR